MSIKLGSPFNPTNRERPRCIVHREYDCPECHLGMVPPPQIVHKREGMEYVPLPEGATEIKAATVFNGMLIIACDNGPFYRGANGWERIG